MKINQVACQLYTLRDHLKTPTDIASTLKRVREIGYQSVQVSGMGPIPEEDLNNILAAEGLTCCATHESSDVIRKTPEVAIERLKKLNCPLTAYPYPKDVDMADASSINALIADLNRAGELMATEGITLTYHNHGIEFVKTDGITALDRIYDHSEPKFLQGELDTYWIHYGGGDVAAWCKKLANRLPLIHLKDYCFTTENKPTFCEIGAGTLDFKAIVAAAEASGCQWFVVEQDTCPGDPFDSIQQSFDYIATHLCA